MAFHGFTVDALKAFVAAYEKDKDILLKEPKLSFFFDFIRRIHEDVEEAASGEKTTTSHPPHPGKPFAPSHEADAGESTGESDFEEDREGVVDSDHEDMPEYPDTSIEVTEEMEEDAHTLKGEAMEALSEGDTARALEKLNDAIAKSPNTATLYASRARIYVSLKRPNAAIMDCDRAIQLNPDNARAHKYRGEAYAMKGAWERAAKELSLACALDYDDETNQYLKKVQPKADRIAEHRTRTEQKRAAKARRIHEKAERARKAADAAKSSGGGCHAGGPCGSGTCHDSKPKQAQGPGVTLPPMAELLKDPDVRALMSDPTMMAAFQDVMANPANISKYQSDPRVQELVSKLAKKYGAGGGAAPGGHGHGHGHHGPGCC
eukprot:jgi/Mesvir1/7882/Mv11815-RA.1